MQNIQLTENRLQKFAEAIRALIRGGSNVVGQVTLATGAASTVVSQENISKDSRPQLTPATAAAAAEAASVYVSAVAQGSFTIAHPNNATAGRTWNWHAVGG